MGFFDSVIRNLSGNLPDEGDEEMARSVDLGDREVLGAFDRTIVDGGVNGAGWFTRFAASVSGWWDTWIIDGAVRLGSFSVKLLSYPVCLLQSGRVQTYALFVVVGFLAFLGYYVTR